MNEIRAYALAQAVIKHANEGATAETVVASAKAFYKFLMKSNTK